MNHTRQQLTLFVSADQAQVIEDIRKRYNPKQYELIKAHVTLCREAEMGQIEKRIENLKRLKEPLITIDFGKAERFSAGKGILMNSSGNNEAFHQLRKTVLKGVPDNLRIAQPHITLMHPRNSNCTDAIFQQVSAIELPTHLTFHKISLVEQKAGGKWSVLEEFDLVNEKI